MGFITRFCTAILILSLLWGCQSQAAKDRFVLEGARVNVAGDTLNIQLQQRLNFSPAAVEALYNGVPLVMQWDLELRDGNNLTLLTTRERRAALRYLPLSERFQLEQLDSGATQSYPRLRHALRAMNQLQITVDNIPLAPGTYQMRARVRLDRADLPAPMQLPALVLMRWRHDSLWNQWPFEVSA